MTNQLYLSLKKKYSAPILILGLFLVFVFYCNHKALFIADYYILLIIFLAVSFYYLLNNNVGLTFNLQFWCIIVLAIVMLVMSVINRSIIDKGTLISYLMWFLVYLFAIQIPVKKLDIVYLIGAFIVGALICSLLVIIFRHEYGFKGSGRFSIAIFGHEEMDPNYLASYLVIGGALSFYNAIGKDKTTKRKILLYICFFIISTAIILTGSRAGVLSYIICLCGCLPKIIYNNRNKFNPERLVGLMIVILIALGILIGFLPDNIKERIFHMNLQDGSNSLRLAHWKAALECFIQKPLLGYGPVHTVDILANVAGHKGDAHNTYLTYLLQFGIVGFLACAIIIVDILKKLLNKENIFFGFLLLGQLFSSMIIANHLGICLWMTLILCYYQSNRKFKKTIDENVLLI